MLLKHRVPMIVALVCLGIEPIASAGAPDFERTKDIAKRKAMFVEFLVPDIRAANDEIWTERMTILELQSKLSGGLTETDKAVLLSLGARYAVPSPMRIDTHYFRVLLRRVDVVPAALVLAQAANESGWGTSRFAADANNYFGLWCYRKGCGLVPEKREASARHEVRKFATVGDGVRAYLHTINTQAAFADLHIRREAFRESGKHPTALPLSEGLGRYSARRTAYVKEIKSMIQQNGLHRFTLNREPAIGT